MRREHVLLAALLGGAILLAWHNRFIQDDAFISFTYARQLVTGEGLTWFGTRIEGYTNFLWTLWIALGLAAGADAVWWAHLGSLTAYALLIFATWRLAGLLLDGLLARAVAIGLLATNFSVSAYATGGLETMLQTALMTVALWQFHALRVAPHLATRRLVLLSLVLAAGVLTRLDGLLAAAVIGSWGLALLARRRAAASTFVAAVSPFAILVGAWLLWKLAYYGSVLPHSYQVKAAGNASSLANGFLYLGRFLHWYLLWPVLLLGVLAAATRLIVARRRPGTDLLPCAVMTLVWLAYVVSVGGDFMEFRFVVPVAPCVFILATAAIASGFASRHRALPAVVLIAAGAWITGNSYRHATGFTGMTEDKTLDSIPLLGTFYGVYPDGDWSRIGTALGRELADTSVVIALAAAGAIPYYSGIETVDMCGLSDPRIPREGNRAPPELPRPGHQVCASLSYLREIGTHLIISFPMQVRPGEISRPGSDALCSSMINMMIFMNQEQIGAATVVAMPIDDRASLFMWYLTPHPRIDALIESGRWERRRLYVL